MALTPAEIEILPREAILWRSRPWSPRAFLERLSYVAHDRGARGPSARGYLMSLTTVEPEDLPRVAIFMSLMAVEIERLPREAILCRSWP